MAVIKKILITLFTVGLLVLLGVAGWLYLQLQAVATDTVESQRFVVKKGSSVASIAEDLEAANLIKSALIFKGYARYVQLDRQLQAGSYQLSPSMAVSEITQTLTEGSEDIWITLLEGWRREEVAEYLAAQDLTEFSAEEFLEISADSEGMLFPDTYLIPKESTATAIFDLLTRTFEAKIVTGLGEEIAASALSLDEIVTLASLIEREAQTENDMRHVASILYNRMEVGMPLQVDATLQYVSGYNAQAKDWWAPPSIVVKRQDSPFNTYMRTGLPAHAIANPGLRAIKAALNPLETDDLFYLHAPTGEMYYSEDLDTHNAYVDRYLR